MTEESRRRAERLLDEVLTEPVAAYACDCGDPRCIFATPGPIPKPAAGATP